jgi:hypothetical protein
MKEFLKISGIAFFTGIGAYLVATRQNNERAMDLVAETYLKEYVDGIGYFSTILSRPVLDSLDKSQTVEVSQFITCLLDYSLAERRLLERRQMPKSNEAKMQRWAKILSREDVQKQIEAFDSELTDFLREALLARNGDTPKSVLAEFGERHKP